MSKGATVRARQGFYSPNGAAARTRPTLSEGLPRDHGPHGLTNKQTRPARQRALDAFLRKIANQK